MSHRRTTLFGSLLASVALAACNASTASTPSLGLSLAPGSSSTAASAAPSSASSSAASPGAAASADLSQAGTAIANLDSYQAHMTTSSGTADLVIIHKPVPAESFITTESGHKTRIIVIGPDLWLDEGTGTFVKNAIPASAVAEMTKSFDPAVMFGEFFTGGLLQFMTTVGNEQKNGVATNHFHIDSTMPGPTGATIPPGGTLDVWVASDGGYLVAFEGHALEGNGATKGDIMIEITNINDPANAVTPPA